MERLELNTPQRSDFRPIEAFFSSPYVSMPSEKKHSAVSKLRPFRCFAVLKEQIFVTARQKSARNTRILQRFLTKLWRKYAFQNRMEFKSFHSAIITETFYRVKSADTVGLCVAFENKNFPFFSPLLFNTPKFPLRHKKSPVFP